MSESQASVPEVSAEFALELNELLVSTYGSIDILEGKLLNIGHGLDVSVSESHLLEAVGRATLHKSAEMSVSQVADALGIKAPSATSAVNRLVRKGLLRKERSAQDARRINVFLTREGERVYRVHAIFHQQMAEAIAGDMSLEERRLLLEGIRRLERFYTQMREAYPWHSA